MILGYRRWLVVVALILGLLSNDSAWARTDSGRRVVLIIWDGMRPDFVSEENTPMLWQLAQEGVVFRNHHSVYPCSTEVNGVVMATGVHPGRSGILANHEYRPEIDIENSIDTENPQVARKGDQLSRGKYLGLPTIAELVQQAGGRAVVAAAKGIGLLHDRHPFRNNGVTLFAGQTLPRNALSSGIARLGPFPPAEEIPAVRRDAWTTSALTDFLWKNGVPDFSLLWLSEPDASEHRFAPGSKEAAIAIRSSDNNLARLVAALDQHGVRRTTDILVVSDHGFSTIQRAFDLRTILQKAGLDAVTNFVRKPKRGQIMLVGNGGTVLFYVVEHDKTVTQKLVEFLQQSDFAGVIFTKTAMEGTFSLEQAKIANELAPDVEMAFRWNESKNRTGVPGMIDADWLRKPGQGTHATLSRFDMHSVLIVAGPDFQRGKLVDLPSGNVDLAPTILRILGITSPEQLDGRVLSEAFVNADGSTVSSEVKTIEATREFVSGKWRQTLQISRVGSTIYLDEGNGEFGQKGSTADQSR